MRFLLMVPFSSLSEGKYHVCQSFIMVQKSEPFFQCVNYLTKYDMTGKVLFFSQIGVLHQLLIQKTVYHIHGGYKIVQLLKILPCKCRINFQHLLAQSKKSNSRFRLVECSDLCHAYVADQTEKVGCELNSYVYAGIHGAMQGPSLLTRIFAHEIET